jgi:hypothetical protein
MPHHPYGTSPHPQSIVLTGQTYERSAITHWVDALKRKNKPPTCPTTRTVPPRTPSRGDDAT